MRIKRSQLNLLIESFLKEDVDGLYPSGKSWGSSYAGDVMAKTPGRTKYDTARLKLDGGKNFIDVPVFYDANSQRVIEVAKFLAGFIPVVGVTLGAQELIQAIKEKNKKKVIAAIIGLTPLGETGSELAQKFAESVQGATAGALGFQGEKTKEKKEVDKLIAAIHAHSQDKKNLEAKKVSETFAKAIIDNYNKKKAKKA